MKNINDWLLPNIIFSTKHGSVSYGLNNEFSDLDLKAIVVPPKEVENNLFHRFEQSENNEEFHKKYDNLKNPKNPKIESTIYSLRKIFVLAANVNPNCIEIFFVNPEDHLLMTPTMEKIIENKNMFLSSKAKFSFSGYSFSQLHKIERHRKWIVKGEIKEPKREDFGLPAEMTRQIGEIFGLIKSEVEKWNLTQFPLDEMERDELKSTIWELIFNVSKVKVDEGNWPHVYASGVVERLASEYNLKEEVVDLLQRERIYKKEVEQYKSWLNWKKNRNPERHKLEVKCGYDSKHGSQLVRLLRMGYEIITENKVIVKRPDREELLSIKNGNWSYDKLIEYANEMQLKLDDSYKTTKLPKSVDYEKINNLYHQLYEEYNQFKNKLVLL